MTENQEKTFERFTDYIDQGYEIYKEIANEQEGGSDVVEALEILYRRSSEEEQLKFKAGLIGQLMTGISEIK